MSINTVTLIGHCGRDPEARYFESGASVAEFSLALNNPPKDGVDQEPDWVEIKAWGKTGQVAADYLKKGHRVGITGRLKQERWTTSDGGKGSKLVVVAERLELLTPRDQAGAPAGAAPERRTIAAPARQAAPVPAYEYEEDVPF